MHCNFKWKSRLKYIDPCHVYHLEDEYFKGSDLLQFAFLTQTNQCFVKSRLV